MVGAKKIVHTLIISRAGQTRERRETPDSHVLEAD